MSTTNLKLTSLDIQPSRDNCCFPPSPVVPSIPASSAPGKKASGCEVKPGAEAGSGDGEDCKSEDKGETWRKRRCEGGVKDGSERRIKTCIDEKRSESYYKGNCERVVKEEGKSERMEEAERDAREYLRTGNAEERRYLTENVDGRAKSLTAANFDIQEPSQNCATEVVDIGKIQMLRHEQMSTGRRSEVSNCTLCFDGAPDAVLLECGHGGICFGCGKKLHAGKEKCPLCREPIALVVRIDIVNKYGNFVKVIDCIESAKRPVSPIIPV